MKPISFLKNVHIEFFGALLGSHAWNSAVFLWLIVIRHRHHTNLGGQKVWIRSQNWPLPLSAPNTPNFIYLFLSFVCFFTHSCVLIYSQSLIPIADVITLLTLAYTTTSLKTSQQLLAPTLRITLIFLNMLILSAIIIILICLFQQIKHEGK